MFSVDVSENPYIKSFKPGAKPTSYEMNCDHKTFDYEQKQQKRQRYKTVYIIILRVKELLIP